MLRLLCINNKPVTHDNGITSSGDGLKEGEIYTAENQVYIHPNNKKECFLIYELNDLKLITRFALLSETDETLTIMAKEAELITA